MVYLKTGSPQRWRNGWFENLNIERTFCSNSGGPWVRPLSAPGRGFYPHFHLYEAPTALVPPFATMSRTSGLQKANVVSRSWSWFVASHVTIFGFKIKYCFYLGRSLRIHTNQIHFGHLVRRCFLPTIFYFLWACAEGVVHTQRAEILRFCMERQLKLLFCGFCYPNLQLSIWPKNKQTVVFGVQKYHC